MPLDFKFEVQQTAYPLLLRSSSQHPPNKGLQWSNHGVIQSGRDRIWRRTNGLWPTAEAPRLATEARSVRRRRPRSLAKRIVLASLTFWALLAIDIYATAGAIVGYLDIPLGMIDCVVSLVTIPMALVVAIGLLARVEWARGLGILYVALCLIDGARALLVDSGLSLEAVAGLSVILLSAAAVLWLLDADRLRDCFDPPISLNGHFRGNLYLPVARLALLLLGTTLAASIWGGLVLILWAVLFFGWRRLPRGRVV